MAKLIKMGAIDFIVKERLDRFSRDEVLNIQIMRDARKNNVELHEVNYGQFNPNDRGQRLAWKFRNIEAGEYSEGVSENVARKQRSAMVFNGKDASPCPILGLDYHLQYVGIYVPNEDELKIFEDIATKFIQFGYHREKTIRYCNEKRYTTKVWWTKEKIKDGRKIPPHKKGGKKFNWGSLLNLLGNPKIRGKNSFYDNWNQFPEKQDKNGWVEWEYSHHKEHGPFFSKEFFNRIDRGLEKNEFCSRENEFLFSGILFAPDGSKYGGEAAKGGRNLYYYNRKINKRFPAKQIHKLIFNRLKELLEKSGLLEKVISNAETHKGFGISQFKVEKSRLEKEKAAQQQIVDRFSDALTDNILAKSKNIEIVVKTLLEEKEKALEKIRLLACELKNLKEEEKKIQGKPAGRAV